MNNLKFALRQLFKSPAFTLMAVIALGLGVAANTTIFCLVNTLLLRPAPVASPKDLWRVSLQKARTGSNFEVCGVHPETGRHFTGSEDRQPGQGPVGKRIIEGAPGKGTPYEIIGVVETGKDRALSESPRPVIFRSRFQNPGQRSTFIVHFDGNSSGILAAVQATVRDIDPRLSLSRLGTLEQHLALALFPARTTGLLFSVLGAIALLLAVSGLFGVVAYSVSQRTREIGIRMAVGARQVDVLGMVPRQGMKSACFCILIGLPGALGAARLLLGLLYGISPADPLTYLTVPILLSGVTLIACWFPARRAARIDPMIALRHE